MATELKPCPFCGDPPEFRYGDADGGRVLEGSFPRWLGCMNNTCPPSPYVGAEDLGPGPSPADEELVEIWNHRANPELVERIKMEMKFNTHLREHREEAGRTSMRTYAWEYAVKAGLVHADLIDPEPEPECSDCVGLIDRLGQAEASCDGLRAAMFNGPHCRVCGAEGYHGPHCWVGAALNPPCEKATEGDAGRD